MSEAAARVPVRPAGLGWTPESVWRPLLERSRDALAAGQLDEGRVACLTLLATYRLPEEVRAAVYVNQTAYAQPLTELAPGARWRSLDWEAPDGWPRREPSPVLAGGRLFAFGRAVHPERPGERADVLLTLDDALAVRETVRLGNQTGMAGGFDDVRPFTIGNELHAAVLIFDPDSSEWTRAGLVRIADGVYSDLRLLQPRAGYFRKGLAPLETEDGPRFLAWWEPTEVVRFDPVHGTFAPESLRLASHVAERFRSGSPGVRVPGGHLFLVNETMASDDEQEITLSRFAHIDTQCQLTAISPQCFLADRGGDVACGLARQGDRLIAGFTSASHGAVLATLDLAAVLATLTPVAAPGHGVRSRESGVGSTSRQDGKTARRRAREPRIVCRGDACIADAR